VDDFESKLRAAVDGLPERLRQHILRVEAEAAPLAERHGVDPGRVRLAALGHDLVRHETPARLLELAARYGITPDPVQEATPILLHGPIAARILAHDYGLGESDVLSAIDGHTTGRAGMTAVDKVVFLADKFEPSKLARHPEVLQPVRDAAQTNLDAAVVMFLNYRIGQALKKGWHIHANTVAARNELLAATPHGEE
jgi:predicted HD superfamily hydrolase involved in NAD metabolism